MTRAPKLGDDLVSSRLATMLGFAGLLSTGCRTVETGVDPEALGYGPGPHVNLASGYLTDPVPRPAPTPWTPPERERISGFDGGIEGGLDGLGAPVGPVPYAPDVEIVCEHLAGFGDAPSDRDICLRHYRTARVFRTIGDWKGLVECIQASSDQAGARACETEKPPVFDLGAAYPRESDACMHLFSLLIVEEMGAEPILDRADILDFEPLARECVDSLVQESRKGRSPAEYGKMLTCVEQSETSADAEACEGTN